MSISDRLEQSSINLRYKLHDNNVKLLGKSTKVLRLKITKSKYGDDKNIDVVSKDEVEVILSYPGDIPLTRSRVDPAFEQASNPHLYLFDILPIDLFTKWTDNVEKYDIIIDKIRDQNGNYIKFILQISELVGSFRSSLVWQKFQCAPYNGDISKLPAEAQTYIDAF